MVARINTSRYAIGSFTSEKTYELTINHETGEAENCFCPAKHFNPSVPCKHMIAYNQEVQRAATFILLQRMVQEKQETARAWREYAEMA